MGMKRVFSTMAAFLGLGGSKVNTETVSKHTRNHLTAEEKRGNRKQALETPVQRERRFALSSEHVKFRQGLSKWFWGEDSNQFIWALNLKNAKRKSNWNTFLMKESKDHVGFAISVKTRLV